MPGLFDQLEHVSSAHPDYKPPEFPRLSDVDDIDLDCETDGLKWWSGHRPVGIALRGPDGQSWYLPFGHHNAGNANLNPDQVRNYLNGELKHKRITNLNTRFDAHMLFQWGVDLDALGCRVSDVGHHAALLDDHRRKFSLESVAQDYLGKGKKSEGINRERIAQYHPAQIDPYARGDVELVGEIKQITRQRIHEEGLDRVLDLEDDLIYAVCEMERNAAPMDVPLLHEWDGAITDIINREFLAIHAETGLKVNPDSNKDWEKLYDALGIAITEYTEEGRPSFTDSVLERVDNPTVQRVRKSGKFADLKSKYIKPYRACADIDGMLRYALHPLRGDEGGTISGRFSSSAIRMGQGATFEKIGANIQQVLAVKKQIAKYGPDYIIKKLFGPMCKRCGTFAKYCACAVKPLTLSADAKQIEYRLFGHYAASPKILETYANDPDTNFHDLIWGMLKVFRPEILYKEVKNLNFAVIYGAGLAKIALMMGFITEQQFNKLVREHPNGVPKTLPILADALEVKRIYDRELPEVMPLLRRASDTAGDRGFVRTVLGRRSRFPNRQRLHKALNAIIQGSAADVMKRKLVELYRTRKETGFVMRMTVHDEVVGDCPDLESARLVEAVLQRQSFDLKIPILWDVKVGPNWADVEALNS